MGGLGRIIGGALAGLGDGLEKQTAMNFETQKADLANEREIALAKLKGGIDRDNTDAQYNLMDRNAARDDARGFAYGTQQATQKQGFEQQNIVLKGKIDLNNDKTIENLKSQHNITEGALDDARQLQHDLDMAGQTVDHWEVTSDGKMVAFNKLGGVLRYSENAGSFNPPHVEDDGTLGDGTIAGARAARGTGTQPNAKPAKAPNDSQKNVNKSILGQLSRMPPPPDGAVGRTMTGPPKPGGGNYIARWDGKQWVLEDVNGG